MESNNTIMNLPSGFLDTLTSDELEKLRNANNDLNDIKQRFKEWNGDADLKAHIAAVSAKQAAEQAACERIRSRFK